MPALNDLLASFGIAFGDAILEGQVPLEPDKPYYASGANIVRFPAGGHLHGWQLADKATEGVQIKHRKSTPLGALKGAAVPRSSLRVAVPSLTYQSPLVCCWFDAALIIFADVCRWALLSFFHVCRHAPHRLSYEISMSVNLASPQGMQWICICRYSCLT